MRRRFLILYNRAAGRTVGDRFETTLAALRRHGAGIEVVETREHGEAARVAADAARAGEVDAVVAAGGDGTLHDAASGLAGTPMPFGILPLGTGNVLARELGVPFDPAPLAAMLTDGPTDTIRLGSAGGKPFLFVVGIGFDAEAVRLFENEGGRAWGRAGFVGPVLQALGSDAAAPLRVVTPEGESEAHWVLVTRAKRYAGSFVLDPDADLRDPWLHVLTMQGRSGLDRTAQLAALAAGRLRFAPGTRLQRVTSVRIEGSTEVPVQIDGEVAGVLPLDLGLHPDPLRVILPVP